MKKLLLIFAAAFVSFSVMSAQDLESATNAYNEGATALNEGNFQLAIEKFEDALSQATAVGAEADELAANCKKAIPALYIQVAKGMINEKNYDGALSSLETATAKASEFGQEESVNDAKELAGKVYMAAGQGKLKDKDYAGAVADFKKATEADAANGQAWLLLGQAASRANDSATALTAFDKARELGMGDKVDAELAKYYYGVSAAAYKAKKFTEAYEAGVKAAAYNTPEGVKALSIAGKAAYSAKKYAEAVDCLTKYIAGNPQAKDMVQTLYQVADSLEKMGKKSEACGYFKQIPASDANFGAYAAGKVKELGC